MSIPARKKKLGNETLLDAWKKLKAQNKALGTPAYKPDITPFLSKYDQDLALFDKLQAHKDDMEPMADTKEIEPLAAKITGHYEELKKAGGPMGKPHQKYDLNRVSGYGGFADGPVRIHRK